MPFQGTTVSVKGLSPEERLSKLKSVFGEPLPSRPSPSSKPPENSAELQSWLKKIEEWWQRESLMWGDPSSPQFPTEHTVHLPLAPYKFEGLEKASLPVNSALRDVFEQTLTDLAAFSVQHGYKIHTLYGYFFRYAHNPEAKTDYYSNPAYAEAKVWASTHLKGGTWESEFCAWAAEWDRARGKLLRRKLSNHAWGTAIDINPQQNGLGDLEFDMPPGIVELMRKRGFGWGGFYKGGGIDTMHFEYNLSNVDVRRVFFPLTAPGKKDPPPRHLYLNESGKGGYYPVSLNQTLHGGVHIHPPDSSGPASGTPVVATLPGYVVAARFMDGETGGSNAVLQRFTDGRPLSFVAVRHEVVPIEGVTPKPEQAFPVYTVYMHLKLPRWGEPLPAGGGAIPWLQAFQAMQFGAAVDLDPGSKTFLRNLWATERLAEGGPYKVADADHPLSAKDGERTLAFARPPPDEVTRAIDAFKKGAIVTFGKPLLRVKGGEIIGLAAPGATGKSYVHWELFSPSGAESGVAKLLDRAGDLKSHFKRVQELDEDNFLELPDAEGNGKNEVKPILEQGLPENERGEFAEELASHAYAGALQWLFNEGATFAKHDKDDAQTKNGFTYPVTLSIQNPYKYKGPGGGPSTLKVTFLEDGAAVGEGTISVKYPDGNMTFVVQVPARADTIQLSSPDFFLDPIPLSPDGQLKAQQQLLDSLLPYRWRHLVLEHVNEWTPSGLSKLLDELKKVGRIEPLLDGVNAEQDRLLAAKKLDQKRPQFEALKVLLRPLTWWGRKKTEEDEFGEVALLAPEGGEETLFGTADHQLPPDAKIDNLHPVAGAWLCGLLQDAKKITFRDSWPAPPLARSASTTNPPFCSWILPAEKPHVGDVLHAVLIQHGYGTGEQATFKVQGAAGAPLQLGSATSADGVFALPVTYSFWGGWELSAADAAGNALDPAQKPCLKLETEKPEIASATTLTVKTDGKNRAGSFKVGAHCPRALAGFLYFRCWRVSQGQTPNFADEPEIGAAALPVIASRVGGEPKVKDVEIRDGFVVGGKPHAKVTKHFSVDVLTSVFESEGGSFKIHYDLCRRLEDLAVRAPVPLALARISGDGLSVRVKAKSGIQKHYDKVAAAASKLPTQEGHTAESDKDTLTVTLSYTPIDKGGELEFKYDPRPALGAIVENIALQPNEALFVKPSFIAPNGGHYVLGGDAGPGPVGLDLATLKATCGGDYLELHADAKEGPLKAFAMDELEVRMTKSGLSVRAELHGDLNKWKKAAPQLVLNGKASGKITGPVLEASWPLLAEKNKPTPYWQKSLDFSVKLAHPEELDAAPTTPTLTFETTPKLEALVCDTTPQHRLRLTGQGFSIPTAQDLVIHCELQTMIAGALTWVPDTAVQAKIRYSHPAPSNKAGYCDELGVFTADIDLALLEDGRKRRFTWRRERDDGKIGGVAVGAPTAEYGKDDNGPSADAAAQ